MQLGEAFSWTVVVVDGPHRGYGAACAESQARALASSTASGLGCASIVATAAFTSATVSRLRCAPPSSQSAFGSTTT